MPDHPSPPGPPPERHAAPYEALASGYDIVMEHVQYALWAEYVHMLLQYHHGQVEDVLELGCGTGSFAFELQPRGPYRYHGTDRAPAMLRVARAKAEVLGVPVTFGEADFSDFEVAAPVDAVILLYDGLNYLLEEAQVEGLFASAYRALRPGGLFVFDQSTPHNSINNEDLFEDRGTAEAFSYVRHSHYDPERRLHTTTFELTVEGETYHEAHVQRAYTLAELRGLVAASPFVRVAAYSDVSTVPATPKSERIHWVLRKPGDREEG